MLQVAGNLGLTQETLTNLVAFGVFRMNLLQGHFAVELAVVRHRNHTQPSLGVRAQDLVTLAPVA